MMRKMGNQESPMAQEIIPFSPLPSPLAPTGWRTLPGSDSIRIFRSPSGLTVSVADTAEERRVVVSRPLRWPTRLELEFVVKHFLGEGLAFEVEQAHGLGPLAVRILHQRSGGQGTASQSRERLEQVALLNEAANHRRDQSSMRASMARARLTTPEGWRKRPSPLGPPVYDRDGFQVIVCEGERDHRRWATLSVGRQDRPPTLEEAQRVARIFLGENDYRLVQPEENAGARKVLVLECYLR
ncbi:MAG: hypothetical protein NZX77_14055, partial [Polyangiaceae bacterium]|nr:hypothetical protein [Polyangiaceae bacterium]